MEKIPTIAKGCPKIDYRKYFYGFLPHFLLENNRSVGSVTIRSGMTSREK
jgi:hypothetical protein